MSEPIRKYYKIIPAALIAVILISGFSFNSFAGTYMGLASAVKSRVQQLKDKEEKKQADSLTVTTAGDGDAVNHPPVISAVTANPASIPAATIATITCSAADQDNDTLTYSWTAANGVISGTGSIITWTAPVAIGSYLINCTVADGKGGTAQQSVTVTVTTIVPPAPANWTKQFGTSSDDAGLAAATDASGNIYVTGWTNGSLDGNTNQGSGDVFLTKYDINGAKLWTKLLGTSVSRRAGHFLS